MTYSEDAELMQLAKAGDETAFKTIVERHHRSIFQLCHRIVGNPEDAEELTQDVFIRLFRSAESYMPSAKLTTYLYRIAVNLSYNRIRDRRRRRWMSLEIIKADHGLEPRASERDEPDQKLELKEMQQEIRKAVDSLPENQRTAVVLSRFQNLSYEEIAEVMKCSVPAVESLLHRARLKLKKKLKKMLS